MKYLKAVLTFVIVMLIATITVGEWIPFYGTNYPEFNAMQRQQHDITHLLADSKDADELLFLVYDKNADTYVRTKKKDIVDLMMAIYHLPDDILIAYFSRSPYGYLLYHLVYVSEVDYHEYYLDGNNIHNILNTFRPIYTGEISYSIKRIDGHSVISKNVAVRSPEEIPLPQVKEVIFQ